MAKNQVAVPKEAIIAVNYHCNAKCKMCDIWELKDDGSLEASDFAKLPNTLTNVGITGGEPFLRHDLSEIIETVMNTCNAPQIIINTNGYLTQRIVRTFEKFRHHTPQIGFRVSLDGIGEMHDEMRGTRHAFKKVMRTIEALKQAGAENVGFSFTATNDNIDEVVKVHELAQKLGVQFAGSVAHNSDIYFHKANNAIVEPEKLRKAYASVNRKELASLSIKNWYRAYYNAGIIKFNEQQRRLVHCTAASDFFYLDPHGEIFPCLIVPSPIGNIRKDSFQNIWASLKADAIRDEVKGCEKCWMMCTARTNLKKQAVQATTWVAKQKLRLLLGDKRDDVGTIAL